MQNTTTGQWVSKIRNSPLPSFVLAGCVLLLQTAMYANLDGLTNADFIRSLLAAISLACFAVAGQRRRAARITIIAVAVPWMLSVVGIIGYYRYFNVLPNFQTLRLVGEGMASASSLWTVLGNNPDLIVLLCGALLFSSLYAISNYKIHDRRLVGLCIGSGVVFACLTPAYVTYSKLSSDIHVREHGPAARHEYIKDPVDRAFFFTQKAALHKYGYLAYLHFQECSVTRKVDYNNHFNNPVTVAQEKDASHKPSEPYNFIILQVESLDKRIVHHTINGKPVTPFLNKFKQDCVYYPNFYAIHGGGGSADAEFSSLTSLIPPSGCAVMSAHRLDHLPSLAETLKNHGYTSVGMHGNSGKFWNRTDAYKQLGFDGFLDQEYYTGAARGFNTLDHLFLKQSIGYLKKLQQKQKPFLAYLITNSTHIPFSLAAKVNPVDYSVKNKLALNYFRAANYTDKSVAMFFSALKKENLLENTVFIIFGDHNSDVFAEEYNCGKANGENVPLFIRTPTREPEVNPVFASHLDIAPTILDMAGFPAHPGMLGISLFKKSAEHPKPINMDDQMSVITPEGLVPATRHPDPIYARMIQYSLSFFYNVPRSTSGKAP